MNKFVRTFFAISTLLIVSGCAMSQGALKQRAAFDLNCPADQLSVTDLGFRTRGVSGCNKQVTYVRVRGTWVANSPFINNEK